MRHSVERPNQDPNRGPIFNPPTWNLLFVDQVTQPEHEKFLHRSIADIAAELGTAPADTMLDLALSEDLATTFRWKADQPDWVKAVRAAQHHPNMILGISDGGAHLDRDDGSEWSSYFLRRWVLDEKLWSLEEGIRQITQIPAALCGIPDRGSIQPGYWGDLMIFDAERIGPGTKTVVADMPGGEQRFSARPVGMVATIVNGVPIVENGEVTGALPGRVTRG